MQTTRPLNGIIIGESITLVREADLHATFAPFGWSRRQFRLLYNAFGVPYLIAPNRRRWVWLECFQFSFVMALGINQANFISPGAPAPRVTIPGSKHSIHNTRRNDTTRIRKRFADAVNELAAIRHFDHSQVTPHATRTQYEKAAARMISWLSQYQETSYNTLIGLEAGRATMAAERLRAANPKEPPVEPEA